MAFTDVLKKAYPFLTVAASLVPGGNIATTALGQILKLKDGATLDDAGAAVLNAPPEVREALKAEDDRHAEVMAQMGITSAQEFEKIVAADRADARAMQTQTKAFTPGVLAYIAVATLAFCIYMVGFRNLPDTGHDAMMILLGAVVGLAKDVYGYFFGSSSGSAAKDRIIAAQTANGK